MRTATQEALAKRVWCILGLLWAGPTVHAVAGLHRLNDFLELAIGLAWIGSVIFLAAFPIRGT